MPVDGLVAAECNTRAARKSFPAAARRLQRTILLAGLMVAVSSHASAAETRAYLSVTANVVGTVGIRALDQAREIVISADDVERGFVEVAAASRLEVRNGRPSLLEFRGTGGFFRGVRVSGSAGTAEFGADGGTLLTRPDGGGVSNIALNYRFELSARVRPGIYKWPLALTVLPL